MSFCSFVVRSKYLYQKLQKYDKTAPYTPLPNWYMYTHLRTISKDLILSMAFDQVYPLKYFNVEIADQKALNGAHSTDRGRLAHSSVNDALNGSDHYSGVIMNTMAS